MKMKMFVAALFLSLGASSAIAQECNANSSLSHESVRVGNFKDAYEPCMAVLKECPTLKEGVPGHFVACHLYEK